MTLMYASFHRGSSSKADDSKVFDRLTDLRLLTFTGTVDVLNATLLYPSCDAALESLNQPAFLISPDDV